MLESQAPFDTQKLGFVERMDAPMGQTAAGSSSVRATAKPAWYWVCM